MTLEFIYLKNEDPHSILDMQVKHVPSQICFSHYRLCAYFTQE